MKKHPTPQDVLKALGKTEDKIAFVPESQMATNKETAERYISESGVPEGYAIGIIFIDHKRIKRWLIATADEIKQQNTKVS